MFIPHFSLLFMMVMIYAGAVEAQSRYTYSYIPKKVYENQLFPVTVVGADQNQTPRLTYDRSDPTQPVFSTPLQVKNGDDVFYTFYFKAGKTDVHLPLLFISTPSEETTLEKHYIPLEKLKEDENFSGVLATEFKIKNYQVSNFDGDNHIVNLSIEAYEANIEDMRLQGSSDYGIENVSRENAKVTAEFYAVLPRSQEKLQFTYFNTVKQRYIAIVLPVQVQNASVSTQSDLNPKVDAFERLKRYALIFFALFFIVMFIWKRDFLYLVLGVLSALALLTFYIPHKKICVKQGSPLYILPTQTSTIGTRIEKQLDTMILNVHEGYTKIEYKKGVIGWIKDEDICQP